MKVTIRPMLDPDHEMDITRAMIAAIAEELWKRFGGNEKVNWLEAELHLECLMGVAHDGVALPALVLEARASTAALQRRLRRKATHSSGQSGRPPRRATSPRRAKAHLSSHRTPRVRRAQGASKRSTT
jgi:hypothetical protein